MTSELSQQRNDAITYFTSAIILGIGNLTKSFTGAFFSNTVASMFVKFKQNLKSVIEIFWNEVFIIRNTVRKGKSWCLAVICRKRSAFDMQFHLIVVSIFLKTCVKDHGDSSCRLPERMVWLVCMEVLLLVNNLRFSRLSVVLGDLWVSRLLIYCKAVK